ncbi:META domain-containing protein [Streptomyces sp. NRRL WC-3549]|uniref:META domain-containing protein n=1 Tax=Streptomyces sp. NRRL WC-3549 TaxID=1463925 RepID=UPI0004C8795A|nr:META domain-containing protein [Streptomyces sp. NRRL WC-3549]
MRPPRTAVGVLTLLTLAACGTDPGGGHGGGSVETGEPVTGVHWSVSSLTVGGTRTAAPADAHVEIDSEGRAQGSFGCNRFTADVRLDGDGLTVGPATTTAMGCEKDVQRFETALARTFGGELAAVVEGRGDDRTLALTTPGGDRIDLTAQAPAPLTGTAWKVTSLLSGDTATDLPAGARDTAHLTFGEDGSVEGSLGCNSFHGEAAVSGSTITFGPLASTRKACPGPETEVERALSGVLDGEVTYELRHRSLTLTAPDGEGLGATARQARD